jgi:CDK inhibitor PHO81
MLPANRVEDDRRCTSIREACSFARANNLLGVNESLFLLLGIVDPSLVQVMLDERTLIRVPSLVDSIKEYGLLVITFGPSEGTEKTLGSDAHSVDGVLSMASNDFLDAVVA